MSALTTAHAEGRASGTTAPPGRTLALIAVSAIGLGLMGEHVGGSWLGPAYIPMVDLGLGLLMVGCGLAAMGARPAQPAGGRLVLAGFLWFVGTFMGDVDGSPLRMFGFAAGGYHDLVIAWLALSFPDRRPAWRLSRALLVVALVLFVASSVARVVFFARDTFGISILDPKPAEQVVLWLDVAHMAAIVVAGLLMLVRLGRSRGAERRMLAPVLLAGAISCLAAGFSARYALFTLGFLPATPEDVLLPVTWVINAVRAAVPLAMLYGVLQLRGARASMTGAVATVGDAPTAATLRGALAAALGDPDLLILAWDPSAAQWRGTDGTVVSAIDVDALASDPARRVVRVDGSATEPLALLVVSRAVAEDSQLVSAGVALVQLVVRNEQQAARITEQLAETRASRARIVDAADAERRRIEHDLHDGLQQRMVSLAMELRAAEGTVDRDSALRAASTEVLALLDEIREVARGIHPAVLTEAGLAAAIRAAADRSPVPTDVDLRLSGRGTISAQATAYYVVCEALANVAKHAPEATGAWVLADDGHDRIRIVVEDDGPGGAKATGHGLAGLADRVATLDGWFAVEARPGGGTRVVAEVPVA